MKPRGKKIITAAVVLTAFQGMVAAQQQEISLMDAVQSATRCNEKVLQFTHRREQRSFEEKTAVGSFFPSISLNAGYYAMKDPLTISLDEIREAILQTEASDQVKFASIASQMKGGPAVSDPNSAAYKTYYGAAYNTLNSAIPHFIDTLKQSRYPSAQINLTQPIFTGGRLFASAKAAHAETKEADFELAKIKHELTQDVVVKYLTVALQQKVVDVRKEALTAMERHCVSAEKMAQAGVIAKYHLLRAKVAVSEARRNLFTDSTKLAMAQMVLARTLNDGRSEADMVASDTMMFKPFTDSIVRLKTAALRQQPIFFIVNEKKNMVRQKTAAQLGAFLPQIAAFGKVELFPQYLSDLEPPWVVGVCASLDLFSGAKTLMSLNADKCLESQIEAVDSAAHHDVDLWITTSYQEMQSARQRFLQLEDDAALAEENFRQCQRRFETGYGTSLEVVDAHLVLQRSCIDRLVALYDYYKAMTSLFTASGEPDSIIAFISNKGA